MTGQEFVGVLRHLGITHVIYLPDSETGRWDADLASAGSPMLIRPTREGEGIGIAAGLMLGGAKPLVVMQCTGLFEAGDALRNVVHDLKLPLILVVGVRSYLAHQRGQSTDTCPVFTEQILQAWRLPYHLLGPRSTGEEWQRALGAMIARGGAGVILLPE